MLGKSALYVVSKWMKDECIHKLVSNVFFFFSETLHRLEQIYVCSQGQRFLHDLCWASPIISSSVCIPTLLFPSSKFYFVHNEFLHDVTTHPTVIVGLRVRKPPETRVAIQQCARCAVHANTHALAATLHILRSRQGSHAGSRKGFDVPAKQISLAKSTKSNSYIGICEQR